MNYKLVCWDDFSIPVPVEHDWLAFDMNGECFTFEKKPITSNHDWHLPHGDIELLTQQIIPPPEPGSWDTQLYWIGD